MYKLSLQNYMALVVCTKCMGNQFLAKVVMSGNCIARTVVSVAGTTLQADCSNSILDACSTIVSKRPIPSGADESRGDVTDIQDVPSTATFRASLGRWENDYEYTMQ